MKVQLQLLVLILAGMCTVSAATKAEDIKSVKQVIESAYVKGIHTELNESAIREGFHPQFTMMVHRDGLTLITLDQWVDRMIEGRKKRGKVAKKEVSAKFPMVEVEGNAAVARIEMYHNGKHIFTDFMSLYKFEKGWQIVNKIFQSHR